MKYEFDELIDRRNDEYSFSLYNSFFSNSSFKDKFNEANYEYEIFPVILKLYKL